MDVRADDGQDRPQSQATTTPPPAPSPPTGSPSQLAGREELPSRAADGRGWGSEQVARVLGEHRQRDLGIAAAFMECRGLSQAQVEDIYQETVLALVRRPYREEKHLCDALYRGIKLRASRLYRDEHRHEGILAKNAQGLYALERARSIENEPEQVALAREDRLIITEFLAELTPREREAFWLSSEEGMHYKRIAKTLQIPVNEARNLYESCERKRAFFQLLHDSGRLCGYRSQTIRSLLEGQAASEQLKQQALAHLKSCARCRQEHHTNAEQLRRAFKDKAAILLPPVFLDGLDHLRHGAGWHARVLAQRLHYTWTTTTTTPTGTLGGGSGMPDGVRERTIALLAGSGASAKIAAGAITAAVIAGGAITAATITHTTVAHHHAAHRRPRVHTSVVIPAAPRPAGADYTSPPPGQQQQQQQAAPRQAHHPAMTAHSAASPGHILTHMAAHTAASAEVRREPGGFAYLGVPTTRPSTTPRPTDITTTTTKAPQSQQQGGAFSP